MRIMADLQITHGCEALVQRDRDEEQTPGDYEDGEEKTNNHEEEEEPASSANNSSNNQLTYQIADQRSNSSYDPANREAETRQANEYRTRFGRRRIRPQ